MAPHSARTLLKSLRSFMRWCVERKLMRSDPTLGIRLKVPTSDGFATWTEDEIAAFEACHAVGTRARLAFALGLFTAQRRGDVVRIGRQHIRDGVLTVRQAGVGARLVDSGASRAEGDVRGDADWPSHIAHDADRQELPSERLHRAVSPLVRCRRSAAALRLPWVAKSRLPQVGGSRITACEIAAIPRTQTLKEVERYTKAADQARLARAGMERIGIESVKAVPVEVSKPLKPLPKKAG